MFPVYDSTFVSICCYICRCSPKDALEIYDILEQTAFKHPDLDAYMSTEVRAAARKLWAKRREAKNARR